MLQPCGLTVSLDSDMQFMEAVQIRMCPCAAKRLSCAESAIPVRAGSSGGVAKQSARPRRKSFRRNTWRWPAECGRVERSTGKDRSSNGASGPRVSVDMGCVIDIGEPAFGV
jgi:hypothetical protein